MIIKGDYVTVNTNYIAKRLSRCACNANHLIYSGDIVTKHCDTTQPNGGLSICVSCYNAIMLATDTSIATKNDNHDTKSSINHTLEIIAPIADFAHYTKNNFTVRKVNKDFARYTLHAKNRYTSGHAIKSALANNRKVFVNGVQIATFEEFDLMTRA